MRSMDKEPKEKRMHRRISRASRTLGFLTLVITLLALGAGPALATSASDIVEVWPHQGQVVILYESLALNENQLPATVATSEVATMPLHGTLSLEVDHFLYTPSESFWTLGTDTFVYSRQLLDGVEFGTVLLVAKLHGRRVQYHDFEDGSSAGLHPAFGPVVDADWAIAGSQGCLLSLSQALGDVGLLDAPIVAGAGGSLGGGKAADGKDLIHGSGSANSGGSCIRVSLPPNPQGGGRNPVGSTASGGKSSAEPYTFKLFSTGVIETNPAVELRVRVDPDPAEVNILEAEIWGAGGQSFTATTPLPDGEHLIHTDWWKKQFGGPGSGGMMVFLDGEPAIIIHEGNVESEIDNELAFVNSEKVFVVDQEPTELLEVALDDIEVLSDFSSDFSEGRSKAQVLLCDSFEGTTLSSWSNGDSSQAQISSNAALTGKRGMEVDLTTAYPRFVIDNTPAGEAVYNTRFRINPTALNTVKDDLLHIFSGASAENVPLGKIPLQIWMVERVTGFEVQARFKHTKTNAVTATAWIPIPVEENVLELQWWTATREGGANGGLRFWVNGVEAGELVGLDNYGMVIESVRLGVKNPDPGSTGTMRFDDFQSWGGIAVD